MKKFKYLIIITFMILFSCQENTTRNEYIAFDTLHINFKKPILEGEWIALDGVKFIHSNIDTIKSTIDTRVFEQSFNSPNIIVLPSSQNYILIEGHDKWFRKDFDNYEMAATLINGLLKQDEKNQTKDIVPTYQFIGSPYLLYEGKVTLTRTDGRPIKAQKSNQYGASLSSHQ
jgi:hypothetical protein